MLLWLGAAAVVHAQGAALPAAAAASWPQRLETAFAAIDAAAVGDVGVYLLDMDSGLAASHRADETWYLASMVKVPVAIAVLRGIERGEYALDTRLTLRESHYVDGAGATNRQGPGARLSIRFLMEQMLIESDNTATDMLIDLAGIEEVNAVTRQLVPAGLQPITTLADVRRQIFSHVTPQASRLSGRDFLAIRRQPTDAERVATLARLLDEPAPGAGAASLGEGYTTYYASGLNSGRLDAYAELLALVDTGHAVGPAGTAFLRETMTRTRTGDRRIKAGLPSWASFAHKTGTQRARICDAGIIGVPPERGGKRVVVVACAQGDASTVRAEQALREVGEAIRLSGVLDNQGTHESSFEVVPAGDAGRGAAVRPSAASGRAVAR